MKILWSALLHRATIIISLSSALCPILAVDVVKATQEQQRYGANADWIVGLLYGGAHWRHLADTIEPSICVGYAALCQKITLAICSILCQISGSVQGPTFERWRFWIKIQYLLRFSFTFMTNYYQRWRATRFITIQENSLEVVRTTGGDFRSWITNVMYQKFSESRFISLQYLLDIELLRGIFYF